VRPQAAGSHHPKKHTLRGKRLIGRKFSEMRKKRNDLMPYKMVKADNGGRLGRGTRQGHGPVRKGLSRRVAQNGKKTAKDYLGEPLKRGGFNHGSAYFNDSQRRNQRRGRIAGLEVKRIINEPTARLCFGLDKPEG